MLDEGRGIAMLTRVRNKLRRALCGRKFLGSGLLLLFLSACGLVRCTPDPLPKAQVDALYETPLSAPEGGLRVFHLGHSLVNRDMPHMLAQLAEAAGLDHSYESQIGWGTPLKSHWEPSEEIFGFEMENDHPRYRDVMQALNSGDYDVFVLTEMVEIRDAIEYFDSAEYLHKFASKARQGRPDVRVYLYETWHFVNDPEGWRVRLEKDRDRYWEERILRRALAYEDPPKPIYIIPAGQVFAEIARRIEAGTMTGLTRVEDLFARTDEGELDPIHMGPLGNYVVALTHFAVIYHRSPVGLPTTLALHDGARDVTFEPEQIEMMQEIIWDVVAGDAYTGVTPR
ncbi:MAG: hypothetical protein AAF891_00415 [Pseudomonadota bacterium]